MDGHRSQRRRLIKLGLDTSAQRDQQMGAADPRVDSPVYISQDEDDDKASPLMNERDQEWTIEEDKRINGPSFNTRSKARSYQHNSTAETMLTVLELTNCCVNWQVR